MIQTPSKPRARKPEAPTKVERRISQPKAARRSEAVARALSDAKAHANDPARLRALFASSPASGPRCPVCEAQVDAEARYTEALVATLESDLSSRARFKQAEGLCRPHTLRALRLGGPGAALVAESARRHIEAMVRDLHEVVHKEDHHFRHEPRTESERTAPGRAIAWAAGFEGLSEN